MHGSMDALLPRRENPTTSTATLAASSGGSLPPLEIERQQIDIAINLLLDLYHIQNQREAKHMVARECRKAVAINELLQGF